MLYFNDERHEYRLDNPITGELCISATTFIDLFKNYYDSDFWSWYTALRMLMEMEKSPFAKKLIMRHDYNFPKLKYRSTEDKKNEITAIAERYEFSPLHLAAMQKIVLNEWKVKNKNSQIKGTGFHNHKEGEVYNQGGIDYEGVFAKVTEDVEDLSILHNPNNVVIAPELRMFNRRFLISGTADKVFIYPNKQIDIDDWKTNEEIKVASKYKDKMLGPVKHLDDCNYNHYRLQISLYAWMLEQWGYKPRLLRFTHVDINPVTNEVLRQVEYQTHYMKKEIESMIEYYVKNKEELLANKK